MTIFDFLYDAKDLSGLKHISVEALRAVRPPRRSQYTESRSTLFPKPTQQAVGNQHIFVDRVAEVHFKNNCHIWDNGTTLTRFAIVTSGKGWFISDQLCVELGSGDFFTRPEHEPYDIITDQGGLNIIVISCVGSHIMEMHKRYFGEHCQYIPSEQANRLVHFERMLADCTNADLSIDTQQVHAIVHLHTEIIIRSLSHHCTQQNTEQKAQRSFERCRHYIHNNAQNIQSCATIAQACDLDISYMGRLFKRFAKCSPLDYLTQMKMAHATELLNFSDLSIQEISDELTFNDPFTFSRSFKRVMGCSPSAYRKQNNT